MPVQQSKALDQINNLHEKVTGLTYDYWYSYSNMSTWQFWVLLAMFILPLVALYYGIDRKKALRIGFFGFNVHVWFHYIDAFGVTHGFWNYPYKVIPFLSVNVALDASLIPVTFMLLYQWTLNHGKNYYLYAFGYSVFLSFLFKPALVTFDLFRLYDGTNYVHLLLWYISISLISKWITELFVNFENAQQQGAGASSGGFKWSKLLPGKQKAT